MIRVFSEQAVSLLWDCAVLAIHILRILVELCEETKDDILLNLKILQTPAGPPNKGFPKGLVRHPRLRLS